LNARRDQRHDCEIYAASEGEGAEVGAVLFAGRFVVVGECATDALTARRRRTVSTRRGNDAARRSIDASTKVLVRAKRLGREAPSRQRDRKLADPYCHGVGRTTAEGQAPDIGNAGGALEREAH